MWIIALQLNYQHSVHACIFRWHDIASVRHRKDSVIRYVGNIKDHKMYQWNIVSQQQQQKNQLNFTQLTAFGTEVYIGWHIAHAQWLYNVSIHDNQEQQQSTTTTVSKHMVHAIHTNADSHNNTQRRQSKAGCRCWRIQFLLHLSLVFIQYSFYADACNRWRCARNHFQTAITATMCMKSAL